MTRLVKTLGLGEARLLVDAALAHGELVAFSRQDDAPLLSAEIARSKAFTARSLNMADWDALMAVNPRSCFLASGASSYMTGQALAVDGGVY